MAEYDAFAVAVPTFTFDVYVGTAAALRPGPVTVAEHGVCAAPVNTTDAGQLTMVDVGAGVTWKFAEPMLA